jgi:glycerophosphoryl diester phosphodiesterase
MRPVVIAHRGASGYLPEHTLPAKALAYAMGADYLEQDVVATRDDQLVVLHDIHLDRVTDVARRFPGRNRSDGRYYVRDFDMDEIRSLKVHERTNPDGSRVYPGRFDSAGEPFRVHTFAEELEFINDLAAAAGRPVGVYPEIKAPEWHRNEGVDITPQFLEILERAGYRSHDDPVYVQCFDPRELVRIRKTLGSPLKLVQLIGDPRDNDPRLDWNTLLTRPGLDQLATVVDGIGPWIQSLYTVQGGRVSPAPVVEQAHAVGLAVHPYTFRLDELPPGFDSFEALVQFCARDLAIDGLFTDFPDQVLELFRRIFSVGASN